MKRIPRKNKLSIIARIFLFSSSIMNHSMQETQIIQAEATALYEDAIHSETENIDPQKNLPLIIKADATPLYKDEIHLKTKNINPQNNNSHIQNNSFGGVEKINDTQELLPQIDQTEFATYDAQGNIVQVTKFDDTGSQYDSYYDEGEIVKESAFLSDGSQHHTYYPGNNEISMNDSSTPREMAVDGSSKIEKPILPAVVSKTIILDPVGKKQKVILKKADTSSKIDFYDTSGEEIESTEIIKPDASRIINFYNYIGEIISSENYDSNQNLVEKISFDDDEVKTITRYDSNGEIESIKKYDPDGELTSTTNADGTIVETYTDGKITSILIINVNGASTTTYDANGKKTAVSIFKMADRSSIITKYNVNGKVIGISTTTTDLNGNQTKTTYDTNGKKTAISIFKMADRSLITTEYNVNGKIKLEIVNDANGNETTTDYDANSKVISILISKKTENGTIETIEYRTSSN